METNRAARVEPHSQSAREGIRACAQDGGKGHGCEKRKTVGVKRMANVINKGFICLGFVLNINNLSPEPLTPPF